MCCRDLLGLANAAYLEGFPFPALLSVAPYCVPGGIRVVSKWLFLRLARTGTRRIENTDCRTFVIYSSGHVSRSRQRFRRILEYVGPLGRAANLTLSVHDLGDKVAGVEVGHEATDLAAFYLQDAHTVVGDRVPVRSTLRRPLQRRTLLGGENVSELGPHLAEGATVAPPELAQAFVASEDTRHRDVAHFAVSGVHLDQGLDVLVFLQLSQRLDEAVRHLFRHVTDPFSYGLLRNVPWSSGFPRQLYQGVVSPVH